MFAIHMAWFEGELVIFLGLRGSWCFCHAYLCIFWSEVWPENWWRHDDRWYTWHHCEGYVRGELKTDGLMRRVVSDPATLPLSFLMY
jgi:hypothetical protein